MPYAKNSELPKGVTEHLPEHAQTIYREAYNSAFDEYKDPHKRRGDDTREETAHKVAWAAVKNKYEKNGEDWTKR